MLYHVYLSPKYHHDVWAIQKEIKDAYPKKVCHMPTRHVKKREREREKRCIPKEGMPHAHKACQKKEKKERENIAHTKKFYKGKNSYEGVSSTIHQKYPHTCTSWSRLMTCFSCGSGLWLSEIWEASLPLYPPYLQIHQKDAIRSRMEKERRIKRPWWGMKHIERSKRSPEEL